MAKKKMENLSKLTFSELKDKAKEIEGLSVMNRFELTGAIKQAQGEKACCCNDPEKCNPRNIKPQINSLKQQLSSLPKSEKKARKGLRDQITALKRNTRCYL